MKPPLSPLTSLRFFAALGVFVFHFQSIGGPAFSFAAQGVSFFFVLSGFILTYAHPEVADSRDFYVRRLARIWPVHLLAMAIAAALLSTPPAPLPAISNVLLLHAWVPTGEFVFSLNAVSWSVSCEIFFYLLFPLILRAKRLGFWIGGSALLTLSLIIAANLFWGKTIGDTGFAWFHVILQHPLTRLVEFMARIAVGRYFLNHAHEPPRCLVRWPTLVELATVGLIAMGLALTTLLLVGSTHPRWTWLSGSGTATWFSQIGTFPLFALTIFIFAHGRGQVSRWLSHPSLVLLGEISYSTYMLHQLGLALAARTELVTSIGFPLAAAAVVAGVYAASYASWRWIEKPAHYALIACIAGRKPRRDNPPSRAS